MYYLDVWNLAGAWWLAGGLAATLLIGLGLCRVRPGRDRGEAALLFLAPASLAVLAARSTMHALYAAQFDWSSGRLAPAIALFRGYRLYYEPGKGPIYNTIYPPMAYLAFLPAACFGDPTTALIVAAAISQALVLGPMLAIALAPHGDEGRTRGTLLGLTAFLGFWKVISAGILGQTFTLIHADAPALGFATLSVAVLYARRFEPSPSARTLLGSAVFASLAVWTKQIYAPLFVVLPGWVLLTVGLRAALRASAWQVATLGATAAIFCGAFGTREMAFNILTLPRSHPWIHAPETGKGLQLIGLEFATVLFGSLVTVLTILYFGREASGDPIEPRPGRLAGLRATLRAHYGLVFVALAASLVPFGLLSRIKVGGHFNSYAHALYFLSAAPCVLLMDWHARNRERGRAGLNVALAAGLLVSTYSPISAVNSDLLVQYNSLPPAYQNSQEAAYQYARKHPGEAYFPWNPLSTLLAEGRADHFEPGMMDRELGGFAPTEGHFRRFIPKGIKLLAYPPGRPTEWARIRYLAVEFPRPVEVPELPGWTCYGR